VSENNDSATALFINGLRPLRLIKLAIVSENGRLLDASSGFLEMLPEGTSINAGVNVAARFIHPPFNILKAKLAEAGTDYIEGAFTIGEWVGNTATFVGMFYRYDGKYVFLAEPDQQSSNETNEKILSLNQSLVETQRQLSKSIKKIGELEEFSRHMSLTDKLTGLGNRREYEKVIGVEIERASRENKDLGMIMADLDHFKNVNDEYGHGAGDIVLKYFSDLMTRTIRKIDIATRFGGEEFIVILPGANREVSLDVAERIRTGLEKLRFPHLPVAITASFGVTTLLENDSSELLLERVDKALYLAKNSGRNRVEYLP
jgi:diguanylate cyclase (GGDEF)-like protein